MLLAEIFKRGAQRTFQWNENGSEQILVVLVLEVVHHFRVLWELTTRTVPVEPLSAHFSAHSMFASNSSLL